MYDHSEYQNVPERTLRALDRWAQNGEMGGNFVGAVLENDLARAVGYADEDNLQALPEIVQYCWNEIPHACWGSPEKTNAWARQKRGLTG